MKFAIPVWSPWLVFTAIFIRTDAMRIDAWSLVQIFRYTKQLKVTILYEMLELNSFL